MKKRLNCLKELLDIMNYDDDGGLCGATAKFQPPTTNIQYPKKILINNLTI